jgi:hypothetical protein
MLFIFILKSMVFPTIWFVHRSAISARIALLAVRFVLKSHFLSANHIRVLTSANQSYLIMGFKQSINFKKIVIWQISKNKKFTYDIYHDYSWRTKQFFAHKKNMDSCSKLYQRIANNFNFFWDFINSNRQKCQQKQI